MGASLSSSKTSRATVTKADTTNITKADTTNVNAPATWAKNLLGDKLASSAGMVSTTDALAGKTVGLYFSAHWCPPCRGFTPVLAKAYTADLKAKGLEIVFVSSDRDEGSFNSYFGSQPWLALPFSARKIKAQLGEKYGVQGIPTLVLLNSDGTLLTKDGRAKVMQDPKGKWVPPPKLAAAKPGVVAPVAPRSPEGLSALLGTDFLAPDGKTRIPLADVTKDAPLVALYFSAHWCGPCRSFTPKLVTFVEMLQEEGVELPVIFGSSDRDATAFDDYFSTMPWCAFPHADPRIEALKSKYAVSGIPWLVVLDAKTGDLVVNEADTDIPAGVPAYQKWLQQAKKQPAAGAPAA